jgi:DNA repair exonuclease SbcCD ATPase subunit
MKYLFCSDLHASNQLQMAQPVNPDGLTDRLDVAIALIEDVYVAADTLGIDDVFFLGDLFDRKNVDLITMKYVLGKLAEMAAKYSRITFHILPGNHDAFDSAGWHYSVDIARLLWRPNIQVMRDTTPLITGGGGIPVHFYPLPYANRETTMKRLTAIRPDGRVNILLAHHEFIGGKQGKWICDDGIDPKHVKQFDAVFSGHFHEPQTVGDNVVYIGSMLPLIFGDSDKRGYVIVKVDRNGTVDFEHYQMDNSPVFLDVDLDLSKPDIKLGDYKHRGAYTRVKVRGDKDQIRQMDKAGLEHELKEHGVTSFKMDIEAKEKQQQRIEIKAGMTATDLIRSYVNDTGVVEGSGLDPERLIKIGIKCFEGGLATRDTKAGTKVAERAREVRFDAITIKGFASFGGGDNVLEFGKHDLVLISGENRDSTGSDSNGAGKSNLFKSLTWCLWGQTVDGMGVDVVNRDPSITSAKVVLEFSLDKTKYKVERFRGKGSGVRLFQLTGKKWDDISGSSITDTQGKLNNLLGMDMLTFRNTVLYGQNDQSKFTDFTTSDADRKAVLKAALRLDDYDYAQDYAKSERNKVRSEIMEPLTNKVQQIEIQMDGVDITGLEEKVNNFESNRAARIQVVRDDIDRIKASTPDRNSNIKALDLCEEQIKKITALKPKRDEFEEQAQKWDDEMAEWGGKVARLQSSISAHKSSITDIEEQITRVTERDECPECGAKSDGTQTKAFIKRLRGKVAKLKKDIEDMEAELTEAKAKARTCISNRDKAKADKQEIQDQLDDLPRLEQELGGIRQALDRIKQDEQRIQDKLLDIKKIEAETNEFSDMLEGARSKVAKLTRQKHKAGAMLVDAESEADHYDFWFKGFGNQGLPSYILDVVMPTINTVANRYLSILSDGTIMVDMDTQSQLKSGEKRDKIDITHTVDGVTGVVPSGGQQKRISLSIGLALMDVLAGREFTRFNIMLLDEVLDGLDRVGKSRVLDLLNQIKGQRETIYVVSHDPDIVELFDHSVTVVKAGGHSTIK